MRDFKVEIDQCRDPAVLLTILDDLSAEIDRAYETSYEEEAAMRHAQDLELLLRYGEDKLGNLLA